MKKAFIEFVVDFLKMMNNSPEGHSLRKWMVVGFFALIFKVTDDYTTSENLEWVLFILSSTMLTFEGLYTWANMKEKQIKNATEQ